MAYEVSFKAGALTELEGLPKKVQRQVVGRITRLANEPRPPGVKALQGRSHGFLRLRSGNYRIIYAVDDAGKTVTEIGDRRGVYQRM